MFSIATRTVIMAMGLSLFVSPTKADLLDEHPNHKNLAAAFAATPAGDFKPTSTTRSDYLKLIAANIDFFKTCQDQNGAIIDPVSHGERQYSTPAFALAAALLVKEAGRDDLKTPSIKAISHSLTALVNGKAADDHSDFFIPLIIHAYRLMKDEAGQEQAKAWATDFAKLDPEKSYRVKLRDMNWNIVSSSGELLRQRDGLVDPQRTAVQRAYIDESLAGHLKTVSPEGLFKDPGVPLAYDAFSRLWLEDVFADGAYNGPQAEKLEHLLRLGGLSTLLMLSPTGEWPTGGRSSMHNWTDVQIVAICEMNAAYWKAHDRPDIAGAFKRAAHLAFASAARWQRESGELNIIKNRADPKERFAYEPYSNHSQYNLLPMAMLAIAYARADDTIAERPSVAEAGQYVFDLRHDFHKVFAAGSGYYVEIDTAADPHYNATGLQRVHKAGVDFPTLTDSCAPDRAYGDKQAPKADLAAGIAWPGLGQPGSLISLADFSDGKTKLKVTSANLEVDSAKEGTVAFSLDYTLAGNGPTPTSLSESYSITPAGVRFMSSVKGVADGLQVQIPVLINDGSTDLQPQIDGGAVRSTLRESVTTIRVENLASGQGLTLGGETLQNHSGRVKAARAPITGPTLVLTISLEQQDAHLRRSDALKASDIRGVSWSDPRDNYNLAQIVPAGLTLDDSPEQAERVADAVATRVLGINANVVRLGINPPTVSDAKWWPVYQKAIRTLTARGVRVILCAWEQSPTVSENGRKAHNGRFGVGSVEAYASMWKSAHQAFADEPKVIAYELLNEPFGYRKHEDEYARDMHTLMAAVGDPHDKHFLVAGVGYSDNIQAIRSFFPEPSVWFAYHVYPNWFGGEAKQGRLTRDQYASEIRNSLAGVEDRVVITELGCWGGDAYDYAKPADQQATLNAKRHVAYLQGVADACATLKLGSIYWFANAIENRDKPAYDLFASDGSVLDDDRMNELSRAWRQ